MFEWVVSRGVSVISAPDADPPVTPCKHSQCKAPFSLLYPALPTPSQAGFSWTRQGR